jgi:acetylglutamate kinase
MAKPRYIQTPEKLYELFEQYTEDTKRRVRTIPKATNKGVLYEEHVPPLTIDGFKTYANKQGTDINRYWYNVDSTLNEYVSIVTRIKEEIRNDQVEGALVGQYQQNIVARLNNLTEKTDVTTNGEAINEIKISIIRPDTKQLD